MGSGYEIANIKWIWRDCQFNTIRGIFLFGYLIAGGLLSTVDICEFYYLQIDVVLWC